MGGLSGAESSPPTLFFSCFPISLFPYFPISLFPSFLERSVLETQRSGSGSGLGGQRQRERHILWHTHLLGSALEVKVSAPSLGEEPRLQGVAQQFAPL